MRCTIAFTFFLDHSLVHDSKFLLLYVLWIENISRLLKQKVAGMKFCATFYEFKVYIFFQKVLLYLLMIFCKIRIDTLYEENVYRKISTSGEFTPEKFWPIKHPPRKIASQKIFTWNIPTISLIVSLIH